MTAHQTAIAGIRSNTAVIRQTPRHIISRGYYQPHLPFHVPDEESKHQEHPQPPALIHPITGETIPGKLTTDYLRAVLNYRAVNPEVQLAEGTIPSVKRRVLVIACLRELWRDRLNPDSKPANYTLQPSNEHRASLHEDIVEVLDMFSSPILAGEKKYPGFRAISGAKDVEGEGLLATPELRGLAFETEVILRRIEKELQRAGFDASEVVEFVGQLRGLFWVLMKGEELDAIRRLDPFVTE
jgi:hypothetical protein